MKIQKLLEKWERNDSTPVTSDTYTVRLPVHDAARLAALADMYPQKSQDAIISELLSAALDSIEESFPYVQGDKVIAEDELGDPIYEDVGPTPRFLTLSRKHLARFEKQSEEPSA